MYYILLHCIVHDQFRCRSTVSIRCALLSRSMTPIFRSVLVLLGMIPVLAKGAANLGCFKINPDAYRFSDATIIDNVYMNPRVSGDV